MCWNFKRHTSADKFCSPGCLPRLKSVSPTPSRYTEVLREQRHFGEATQTAMIDPSRSDRESDLLSPSPSNLAKPRTLAQMRRFVLWTLAGIGIGLVITLLGLRWASYDPTPTLTPKLFYAAHERWKAGALLNYDIEVRVNGSQPATYRVEVRNGESKLPGETAVS